MELPNHAKQLLLQLNQQRAKGFLCDVIIVVENALFRAHKNILAASSIYFKSLVLHDNLINLDTEMVNPSVFRQVLDFIYTGKLLCSSEQSNEQNYSALLTAASYLQLHDLAALCRRKLKRSGSKPLPGKPSTLGLHGRVRHNNQRLSSSTPATSHNHYIPTPSDADQPQPDEGLRDKLSDDEMFIGSSAGKNGNLSSGGEPDLGLDLSKKSPPSIGTGMDALSPHSNSQESPQSASVSTTNSASLDDSTTTLPSLDTTGPEPMELTPTPRAPEDSQPKTNSPPPRKSTRQVARKKEWPKREASGLKAEDRERPLLNGVIMGPKEGRCSSGGYGSSFTSDQSFQCKEEEDEDGGENGHEPSEESGQSDGENRGKGRGGESGHQSANYVYRQQGFEPAFGDNLYVCIPCGKGFPSSEQLNAHVETHTEDELYIKEEVGAFVKEEEEEAEDLSAPVAPTTFGSSELRPFKCTVCSKSYKDPATLRQHEKSHWLTRPFPCNICGKMFTQRGTMTRHMRSHLGLKPFACEECGMRFTRQYRLTEHMRVHSGEKPYECQLCGGKFTQQRNLISHLRMHTSPS
ncbi:hypermethylated in cancer 2 protein [Esox lucius]|uniref:Hypermethylated in cancer 1 protein n=1 Tax=Esox lucius TaxID=8010 RepID=A0A3P8Z091_ESOLU|nr:hypermethylated in cancer 2 protein [Esox lucius]XP_010865385.2 hypermethylated in cancer 2 protein [Esox lucius]XP_019900061.2 hypermethylated in cancer 2 protein [Esox lucius]XP_019900062.2 hypermethylated in cancer 2 protein [Esox lucius]